jgi:benzoyl-CoA reductase/2-hydroxyglutaryl-CoA dehydratase subunit BcrC/BadD/HgdB
MKFCDSTLLFYPLLRQHLSETGVQSLFLEIEHNNFSEGQIKTRIQAFLEIL